MSYETSEEKDRKQVKMKRLENKIENKSYKGSKFEKMATGKEKKQIVMSLHLCIPNILVFPTNFYFTKLQFTFNFKNRSKKMNMDNKSYRKHQLTTNLSSTGTSTFTL